MISRSSIHRLHASICLWALFGCGDVLAQTKPRVGKFEITAEDRAFWSFQAVKKPTLPGQNSSEETDAIDRHLAVGLAKIGLAKNPRAEPLVLLRRAYLDLLGLPPSPEEADAYTEDTRPDAWERLTDRLLASPQLGPRWARHWLDLARYAETNGYERDGAKPFAWRYRDYVIDAFNADLPYDQFIREQLAGDLADEPSPAATIATGFYRLHVWDDEPDNTEAADYEELDDMLATMGQAFLGMSFNCARCHDHKFDPISQKEYYQLLAFVRNVELYGRPHKGGGSRSQGEVTRALVDAGEVARWKAGRQTRRDAVWKQWNKAAPEEKLRFQSELNKIDAEQPPYPLALAISSASGPAKPTHILRRGDPRLVGEEVKAAFPEILTQGSAPVEASRRELARWVASPSNPLTARVMANRVWRWLFGQGLVPTPSDFGKTGIPPSQPALLDYLATEFISDGWSVKRQIRRIMLSQAYQMSSRVEEGKSAKDEANEYFWRQNLRRVEGEVIRDGILCLSGQWNGKMGGPSFYPKLRQEVRGTQDSADKGWGESGPAERARRSIYAYAKRALPSPLLTAFDADLVAFSIGARPVTTVAPQALMLLNDDFLQEQASAMADRIAREVGRDQDARLQRGFRLVTQREPSAKEMAVCRTMLESSGTGTWKDFCVALLNLSETWYVD